MITNWDIRFLKLAKHISEWSKDPSTKVGAVVSDEKNRIISVGYNGFPRDIPDDEELLNNRTKKYQIVLHGEENAILFAQKDLDGCTVYTYPFPPCSHCASIIIQKGIKRVVSISPTNEQVERWGDSMGIAFNSFRKAGVEFVAVEMEEIDG